MLALKGNASLTSKHGFYSPGKQMSPSECFTGHCVGCRDPDTEMRTKINCPILRFKPQSINVLKHFKSNKDFFLTFFFLFPANVPGQK
jgi:hypothetical protein